MTGVLEEKEEYLRDTQREGHAKTEAEIGVGVPQAKSCQKLKESRILP